MNASLRAIVRIAGICAVASLGGAYIFSGGPSQTPWPAILKGAAEGTAFSFSCASLSTIVLPRLVPVFRRHFSAPIVWTLLVGALVVLAAIATVIPIVGAVAVGYLPARRLFSVWVDAVKFSIYFTLLFGISGTIIAELRMRLETASLALRTKERDEAEARRASIEAQLSSLESRVQPHFFFNTLNTIAALVREDPASAERVVEQLGALMRSSLDAGASPLVPFDQELALVRGYLDIEQIRFGSRLRYDINVDEGAGSTLVPRLSLQTLVENSVKYAVSPRRDGGSITVRAGINDGHLRFEISDDGPGFDPGSLPEGHGLALLRSRLSMLYGERASLDIRSRPAATSVIVQVPG